jgi:hypothetical protein
MPTSLRDRLGAVTGVVYVVLVLAGNTIATAGIPQPDHATGEQALAAAAHQASSPSAVVGFALETLSFVAFMFFLGYLSDVLRRRTSTVTSGTAAGAAVVAGVVMLAVKLGSAAPMGALFLDRARIGPALAQVLNDVNGVAFVVSWLPFAVFVAATAAALHRVALVGRPTAYVGLALGVAGVVLAVIGMNDPVGATPMGFLLGLLWLLVVSVRLTVRPGTRRRRVGTDSAVADTHVAARV